MKKMFLTLIAAALSGLVLAQAPADRPKGPRGPRGGTQKMDAIVRLAQNPKMAEKLGLTAEQSAKLAELNKNSPKTSSESHKKMRAAMEKQAELLKAQPIDEAAVMASIDEVFELRRAAAKEQMKKVIAVRTILTPEQIEKAREALKELRTQKKEGRGPREGRKPRGKVKGACKQPTPPAEA